LGELTALSRPPSWISGKVRVGKDLGRARGLGKGGKAGGKGVEKGVGSEGENWRV